MPGIFFTLIALLLGSFWLDLSVTALVPSSDSWVRTSRFRIVMVGNIMESLPLLYECLNNNVMHLLTW